MCVCRCLFFANAFSSCLSVAHFLQIVRPVLALGQLVCPMGLMASLKKCACVNGCVCVFTGPLNA